MDTLSQLKDELQDEYQTTRKFLKSSLKEKMIMHHTKKA